MRPWRTIASILCGAVWLQTGSPAFAQSARPHPYSERSVAGATVSPYLNLGVNSNGLSNYQTLVRPLLDQREALARQTAVSQRLQNRPRGRDDGPGVVDPQEDRVKARSVSRRFLNYSHYFPGPR